jgi:hypothetical protein
VKKSIFLAFTSALTPSFVPKFVKYKVCAGKEANGEISKHIY